VATLYGAGGPGSAIASKALTLKEAARYRVWLRFRPLPNPRGPFRVAVLARQREAPARVFDWEPDPAGDRKVGISLPLEATDFVELYYAAAVQPK
jgi:hypothetical protein